VLHRRRQHRSDVATIISPHWIKGFLYLPPLCPCHTKEHPDTLKHQIQARKSCVADARNYRIARRLPVFAVAQFLPKTLIPVDGFSKLHSAWLQKFRDHEFKDWLTRKWTAGHNLLRSLQRSRVSEPGNLRR